MFEPSNLDVRKNAHNDQVQCQHDADEETCRNEQRMIDDFVIVSGVVDQDEQQAENRETREEFAGPFGFGGNGIHTAEQAETCANNLCQTGQNFGKVTAGLLLNAYSDRQKAKILHIQTLGQVLQGFADVTAIGALVSNDPELERFWQDLTPGKQRSFCYRVSSAKTDTTVQKRIAEVAHMVRNGLSYKKGGKIG